MASNHTLFSEYIFTLLDGAVVLGGLLEVVVFMTAIFVAVDYMWKGKLRHKKKHGRQHINGADDNNDVQPQPDHPSLDIRSATPARLEHSQNRVIIDDPLRTIARDHNTFNRCVSVEAQQQSPTHGVADDVSVDGIVFGDIRIPSSSTAPSTKSNERETWVGIYNNSSGDDRVFIQYEEAYREALRMSTFFKPQDSLALTTQRVTPSDSMHVNAAFDHNYGVELVSDEESTDSGHGSKHASDSSELPNGDASGVDYDHQVYPMVGNYHMEVSVDTGLPVTEQELQVVAQGRNSVKYTNHTGYRVPPMEREAKTPSLIPTTCEVAMAQVMGEETRENTPIQTYSQKANIGEFAHIQRTESTNQSNPSAYFHWTDLEDCDEFGNMGPGYGGIEMCVDSGFPLREDDLKHWGIQSRPVSCHDKKTVLDLKSDRHVNPCENIQLDDDSIVNSGDRMVLSALQHDDDVYMQIQGKSANTGAEISTEKQQRKYTKPSVDKIQTIQGEDNAMVTQTETPGAISFRGFPSRHGGGRVSIMRGTGDFNTNSMATQVMYLANETFTEPDIPRIVENSCETGEMSVTKIDEGNDQEKSNSMMKRGDGSIRGRYRQALSGKSKVKIQQRSVKKNPYNDRVRNNESQGGPVPRTLSHKEVGDTSVIRRSFGLTSKGDGRTNEEQLSDNKHIPVVQEATQERTNAADTEVSQSTVPHGIENFGIVGSNINGNNNSSMAVEITHMAVKSKGSNMTEGAMFGEGLDLSVISALDHDITAGQREIMV